VRRDPRLTAGGFSLLEALEDRRHLLDHYKTMLSEANVEQNLVGRSTLDDFHRRHVVDSAQLLCFAPQARVWADLGSGAGLPGLVLAILLRGQPGAKVHVIESVAKKCRFLDRIVAALDLPVEVRHGRAEAQAISAEIVTARACAPMSRLLEFALPYTARGARGLFLKGANVETEIAEARRAWRFRARTWKSLSDERGRVVELDTLRHAG
jgi:16S rRNA (guanine527-N7)-methyltransferase